MRQLDFLKILLIFLGSFCVLNLLTGCIGGGSGKDLRVSVRSPDGKIDITLEQVEVDDQDILTYTVTYGERTVIGSSILQVFLAGFGPIGKGVKLRSLEEGDLDEVFSTPLGKCGTVRNLCREARLQLESASGVIWDLELRAYNDGVAFRYGFPKQDMFDEFVLLEESTEFRLEGNPTVLFTSLPSFTSSHENLYRNMPFSELPGQTLIDQPFLAVWSGGVSAALSEARLWISPECILSAYPMKAKPH